MMSQHSKMPGLISKRCTQSTGNLTFGSDYFLTAKPSLHFNDGISSSCEADEDLISFADEEAEDSAAKNELTPWKILITDDDKNVHETTLLALSGVRIHGRPLQFLHAYSAGEARQLLQSIPDIALILLDVVMETVDAGLRLVEAIRGEMNQHDIKIVLRTGQPGYAPEDTVSHQFSIDGYTTKSKLTRSLLISVLSDILGDAHKANSFAS